MPITNFNEAVRRMRVLERTLLEVDLYTTTLKGSLAKDASVFATQARLAIVDFLKGLDIPTTGVVEARLKGRRAALRRMPRAGTLGMARGL